ncbi:MAG: hypothetical protein G8237_13765 [Magnetococcales bacterium]|nr:hypothetical protein [Magnetococcales bacterium]NGZ07412.1 hypothetical protein [Magnetococcales bacterium]
MVTPPSLLPATLVVTRATLPDDWRTLLSRPWLQDRPLQLFFLHHGVQWVAAPVWSFLLEKTEEAAFCAQDHNDLHGPPPLPTIQPGGLATLGRMIHHSAITLSLPTPHWPSQPTTRGSKRIAILFETSREHAMASLRLSAGLAGCDHAVSLFTPDDTPLPAEAQPYLEALNALGARQITTSPDPSTLSQHYDVIIKI